MKRCPQCEFIYEDEQTMCDMDGAILALDMNGVVAQGPRSTVKTFAIPAAVGTALAALLFVAFYSSPLLVAKPDARQLSPGETTPAAPVAAPTPVPPPAIENPSPSASPKLPTEPVREEQAANSKRTSHANHADTKTADSRLTIRRGLPPLPRVPTLPRLPPARVRKSSTTKDHAQVTASQPKKPSKVQSFLKKTGRVITKPFKF